MLIRGRMVQQIAKVDPTPWHDRLARFPFWRESSSYAAGVRDEEHQGAAFFTLMQAGEVASESNRLVSSKAFDTMSTPAEFLEDPAVQNLMMVWADAHARHYGLGYVAKMGLYCFAPGGLAGYHVDGNVYFKGERIDLSDPAEWEIIAHAQSSHRTIVPLFLNPDDEFLIMGRQIEIEPGLVVEFSNTLPHAFFNKGPGYTVLLVTTYKAYADSLIEPKTSFT